MSSERPLFRPEVLEGRGDQWTGELSVVHPLPLGRILAAATAVVLLLVITAVAATQRRYVAVAGTIVPSAGTATLLAPADGVVAFVAASEGVSVEVGTPLIRIDSGLKTPEGDVPGVTSDLLRQQKRSIDEEIATEGRRLVAQLSALRLRARFLHEELQHLNEQLKHAKQQAAIASESLARTDALLDQQLVSALDHARAASEELARRSLVSELQRQVVVIRRQISDLTSEERALTLGLTAAQSELARRSLGVEQQRVESNGRADILLRSPHKGIIGSVAVREGQHVVSRTPVLTVIPAGSRLEAHLSVPPQAVGQLREGQPVSVACDAFPYQQYGRLQGIIKRISLAPIPGTEQSPVYRAVVALKTDRFRSDGETFLLRPGMTVRAEIHTRSSGLLADWLGAVREFAGPLFS